MVRLLVNHKAPGSNSSLEIHRCITDIMYIGIMSIFLLSVV